MNYFQTESPSAMRKRRALSVLSFIWRARPYAWTAAAIVISALGCAKQQAAGPSGPAAVPVVVGQVTRKTVPVQINAIGNVEAYSTVSVKPMVAGPLISVHFQQGDDVTKGQLLFTIDPRPFRAALAQAQATLAHDQAIEANDRVEARRYLELFQQGVAPREQSDSYTSAADAAAAQVKADEAAVEAAQLNLNFTQIYSPLDGRTGALQVYAGNLVKANDVSILVVINQIQPIYVNFAIPEDQLPPVKKYRESGRLRVESTIPNDSGAPEQGTLTFIDNTVDMTTGTIHLMATFANAKRRLWPGQFVNVTLTLADQADTTVVPTQAVSAGQSGPYVFVVKSDGTVESRPIVTGKAYQGDTIVVSGLQPGETVVTDGQVRLTSGAHITIKPAAQASPSAAAPSKP